MFLEELSLFSLQSLRVFVRVASMNSATEAAKALNLSQPALTLQIQNLEKLLGFSLFEKQGRKNVLTARGQELLKKLLPQLENMERLLTGVRDSGVDHSSKLLLGSVAGVAECWLAPRIKEFYKKNLRARFFLELAEPEVLEEKLLSGQISMIFNTRRIDHERLVTQVFLEERLCPVARPDLMEGFQASFLSKDYESSPFWEHFAWIGYGDTDHFDPWTLKWLEHVGCHLQRRFRYAHRANSYVVIREMLLQGMGLCVLPLHTVEEELKKGTLKTFETEEAPALKNQLYISYRESSLSDLHKDFLKSLFAEQISTIGPRAELKV